MFKQAKQNRVFEDVIFQIQEAILEGRLKEGDKLPSERNLREIFKVSRGTMREALRALEQKGLVNIKTGVQGGPIVRKIDIKQMSESLDLLLRYQKISLKELAEFREAVEGLVAAQAAKKSKKEDIKQLTIFLETIKNYLNAGELGWDEFIEEDNKFHRSLAQIAGNRIFESVLNTVYDNINKYFDRFLPRNGRIRIMEKVYQDLCKIAEAIEKRDSNRAQIITQDHIRRFNIMMEKGEKRQRYKRLN
jgi:DNA-binding FadR family transcriptional regulator